MTIRREKIVEMHPKRRKDRSADELQKKNPRK